jgi:hypothetical protein
VWVWVQVCSVCVWVWVQVCSVCVWVWVRVCVCENEKFRSRSSFHIIRRLSLSTLTGKFQSSSPAVHAFPNGATMVYVGSVDGNLNAVDAVSGKLMWQFLTGGPIYSSPQVHSMPGKAPGDVGVIVGSDDGTVYVHAHPTCVFHTCGQAIAHVSIGHHWPPLSDLDH